MGRHLVALYFIPLALGAQSGEQGSIGGQVLNAATGEPIRKVTVTLRRVDGRPGPVAASFPAYSGTTDSSGVFLLKDLAAGSYRLTAERNGFVVTEYGARAPGRPGTTLVLSQGQTMSNVVLRLTPQGVITGRVLDEDGDPVRNVSVQVQRYRYSGPRKQLMTAGAATTNDLGEYRAFDLSPGKYYVSITYHQNRRMGGTVPSDEAYVTTYYPGTKDIAAAAQVDVLPGAQIRNIDVTLIKAHTVRVRGRIVSDALEGPQRFQVVLMAAGGGAQGSGVDPKGDFDIPNVLPGSYVLTAFMSRAGKTYSARRPLEVGNANLEGLVLPVVPSVSVSGRIRVEGQTTTQALPNVQVRLQPFEPGSFTFGPYPAVNRLNADGSFKLDNAVVDHYAVVVSGLPDGFYVKSVRSANVDVSTSGLEISGTPPEPLDILVSPNAGQVTGAVQNPNTQQPAHGVNVVLIPQEKERREQSNFYRSSLTDSSGAFTFRNLPPGDYRVFAWEDVETGAWFDPDFMKPLESKGAPVTIREGSRESVAVTLIAAEGGAN